jgi:hypothetical protein
MAPKRGRGGGSAASDLDDLIPALKQVGSNQKAAFLQAGWGRCYSSNATITSPRLDSVGRAARRIRQEDVQPVGHHALLTFL